MGNELYITFTVRDKNGGKVLGLKNVGLEFGIRKVDEMMQKKYGRKAVRRWDDVVIPPLIDIFSDNEI